MTTLGLKEAKDRVETCQRSEREGYACTFNKIELIKLVRAVYSEGYSAGQQNPETHGDEWDKGYARGAEDAKAAHENNFEWRAQQYMEKQIGHYVSMRRLFQDHGIDRD